MAPGDHRTVAWLNQLAPWQISFWHWWVVAGLLLVLEMFVSTFVLLWLGFAAAAVGFLLLVFPTVPEGAQLALFAFLSLIAIAAWRRHRRVPPPGGD